MEFHVTPVVTLLVVLHRGIAVFFTLSKKKGEGNIVRINLRKLCADDENRFRNMQFARICHLSFAQA